MRINKLKIIDKYILRKFIATFCLAISLIIVIIIVFDVSEKLDDFLENHAPLHLIVVQYYLNFIPSFINLFSPLFVFISVVYFTSKMAGHTEIIAILGNGVSFKQMIKPYIIGSSIIAFVILILGNFVIPINNSYVTDFERKYIKNAYNNRYTNIHIQYREGHQIYAESFDNNNNLAIRYTEEFFKGKEMVMKITADQICYDSVQDKWRAFNYTCRKMSGLKESLHRKVDTMIPLPIQPNEFNINYENVETMNFFKLRRFIKQEELRGSHLVAGYRIEYYQRLLNPLAIIIMTFIGLAVSSRKQRGGMGLHLAIGIAIAFFFVIFMKITTVFATNGSLGPFMAVLLPLLVFGIAAFFLIKKSPK